MFLVEYKKVKPMSLDNMTVEQLKVLLERNIEVANSLTGMLALVPKRSKKYQSLKDQIDVQLKKNCHIHDLLSEELDIERDKKREARLLLSDKSYNFWSL